MIKHYSECPSASVICIEDYCGCEYPHSCICVPLSNVEKRARDDESKKWSALSRDNWQDGYEEGWSDSTAAAVQRVEAHLIMLDNNGWRATLNGEGYSDLAGFGPGVIAAIKGDQP